MNAEGDLRVRRRLLVAAACAAMVPICRPSFAEATPKRVVLVDEPDVFEAEIRAVAIAGLSVDQISRINFAINLRAARAIGITVPAAILARADEVIK